MVYQATPGSGRKGSLVIGGMPVKLYGAPCKLAAVAEAVGRRVQ